MVLYKIYVIFSYQKSTTGKRGPTRPNRAFPFLYLVMLYPVHLAIKNINDNQVQAL
jgi:hypothetical protein